MLSICIEKPFFSGRKPNGTGPSLQWRYVGNLCRTSSEVFLISHFYRNDQKIAFSQYTHAPWWNKQSFRWGMKWKSYPPGSFQIAVKYYTLVSCFWNFVACRTGVIFYLFYGEQWRKRDERQSRARGGAGKKKLLIFSRPSLRSWLALRAHLAFASARLKYACSAGLNFVTFRRIFTDFSTQISLGRAYHFLDMSDNVPLPHIQS